MSRDRPKLSVVPVVQLHPNCNQKLATLHDRIMKVVADYVDEQDYQMSTAELVGIVDIVKDDIKGLYDT